MKQSLLIFITLLLTGASMAQFSDTAQLNSYIRDTIRDRRPEKVTAAQIQKALKGLSNLSSNYNAEIKAKYLSIIARDTAQIVNAKVIFDSLYLGGLSPNNRLLYANSDGKVASSNLEQTDENSVAVTGPGSLQQIKFRDSTTRLYFGDASNLVGPTIGLVGNDMTGTSKGAIGMTFTTKNNSAAGVRVTEYNNGTYTSVFEIQKNFTAAKNRLVINNGNSDDGINALQVNGKAYISDTLKVANMSIANYTNGSTINRTWLTTADNTRDIILQTNGGGGVYMRGSHSQATERGGIDVEYHTANSANASFKIWNVNNLGTYTRKFEVQNNWTYLGNRLLVGSTSDDGSNILQITGKARFSDTVKAMGEVLLPNIQTTTGNTHILTVDGNGVVSKSLPQHYSAPVTLVESTGAAAWNLSLSNIATLSISDDVNLTMTSAQPGQEGKLIVEVTNPGSTINFPAGSLRTISDLDYVGLDNIEVSTKVGFDGSGSPLNGKWICSFLFDGTNYYWNIKRVTTF